MSGTPMIASQVIFGQRPSEEKFQISVTIGMPYETGKSPNEWACPVSISPLHNEIRDVHGDGSLQALCLAVSCVYTMLEYFVEDGGKLLYETGEEFPLKSTFGRSYR